MTAFFPVLAAVAAAAAAVVCAHTDIVIAVSLRSDGLVLVCTSTYYSGEGGKMGFEGGFWESKAKPNPCSLAKLGKMIFLFALSVIEFPACFFFYHNKSCFVLARCMEDRKKGVDVCLGLAFVVTCTYKNNMYVRCFSPPP